MNLIELVADSRLYTLHSHTPYCDGHASVVEMADAAVAAGFTLYGFTPHSPLPIDSPCNMSKADVDAYLADVADVVRKHEGSGCTFLSGMEIDYLGREWGPSHPYFASLPLDYTIGSVHFIPSQEGDMVDIDGSFENFRRKMDVNFHGDIEYVVRTFFSRSADMIEAGGFDILGHFDKIAQNAGCYSPGIEDTPLYRRLVDGLIDMIADRRLLTEINTKAYSRFGRFFPAERHFRRIVDAGVPVLVNSDAHYPDLINASRNEAFERLDRLKSDNLCRV